MENTIFNAHIIFESFFYLSENGYFIELNFNPNLLHLIDPS